METEIGRILRQLEKAYFDLFYARQNLSNIEENLTRILNGKEK